MLKAIVSVIFVLICLALIVIILLQEGKSAGLGSISGILHPAVDKGVLIHWGNRFTHGNREGGIDIHRTAGDYGGTTYIGCGI